MVSMSAPDAAPLPRSGEVFFDVRGDSRVMRLSWYADTGVAVFSIWHGDTCTGTFRLPIPELPRMIDTLSRGPQGAAPPSGSPHAGATGPGGYQQPAGHNGYADAPTHAGFDDGVPGGYPPVPTQAAPTQVAPIQVAPVSRGPGPLGEPAPCGWPGPFGEGQHGGYEAPAAHGGF